MLAEPPAERSKTDDQDFEDSRPRYQRSSRRNNTLLGDEPLRDDGASSSAADARREVVRDPVQLDELAREGGEAIEVVEVGGEPE